MQQKLLNVFHLRQEPDSVISWQGVPASDLPQSHIHHQG